MPGCPHPQPGVQFVVESANSQSRHRDHLHAVLDSNASENRPAGAVFNMPGSTVPEAQGTARRLAVRARTLDAKTAPHEMES
jgi:hypothetical protein